MMKKHRHKTIFLLLAILLFTGCTRIPQNPTDSAGSTAAPIESSTDTSAPNENTPDTTSDVAGNPEKEPGTDLVWEETGSIRINQIGYLPDASKSAVVAGVGTTFYLIPAAGGAATYSGKLEGPMSDSVTGEEICLADFSIFQIRGDYRLVVEGIGASYPFRIADDVYREIDQAALKFFYFQRCGLALEEAYAGDWKHEVCHQEQGIVLEDDSLMWEAPGGWHDAGDYGRYTVNTAVSVADLLLSWDMYPEAFADDTGIPESGNGTPDVLDEARYALEWMLHMQDNASGGVYHKMTSVNFPSLLLKPEQDNMKMYFSPVSSTATADFAAVLALAARVYKTIAPDFSQKCLASAEKAWFWLKAFEGPPGFANPEGMQTGEYGDRIDQDERFWAAAELFRTTGKTEYGDAVRIAFTKGELSFLGLGWQEVSGFGSIAWLFAEQQEKDSVVTAGITDLVMTAAKNILQRVQSDTYGSPLLPAEYGWGSNSGVLNHAILLLIANSLQPGDDWIKAAEACRQYLLGGNIIGQCYFTGFGTKTVLQPHHRPSAADRVKAPVPGMLAGGPNGQLQDPAAKAACDGLPPAACYVDDISSYSTNEIAINWNAPAVFLFAGLQVE